MLNGYPTLLHKDARIQEFPVGWKLSRLGKTCKIRNTLRKPISEQKRQSMRGPYPYYGPTSQVDSISEYRLDGTYTLVGEDGDHFLKYGKMSMTQLISGKSNVNNHAHIIEGTKQCLTEWVYHFFRHRNIYHFLTRQGAGRYKLNKAALSNLPILIPSPSEQKKIVAILFTWDRAIEMTEKLIVAKQKRKQALMQQLLTGKARLPGFSDEWSVQKAGDLFGSRSVKKHPEEPVLSVTQDQGVVRRDELDRKISMDETTTGTYKLVEPEDFVISLRSFQGGLEMSRIRGIVSPAYHVIRPKVKLDSEYFRHFFKSAEFIGRLAVAIIGIRDGKQIAFDDFAFLNFRFPPIDEQVEIGRVLTIADGVIDLHKKILAALQAQKKALSQQLLTGKVRVKTDVMSDGGGASNA